ncbi:ABC transporter substrate-binding protein [Vibrio sp. WZ-1]|uniref:ABC transporter substrate-binding protein n=1 Tax=Vibrio sp. WZ-1 TaxID=3454501 RepID=UPI003F867386
MTYKTPLLLAIGALAATNANASECGTVTIADMNWNSATLIANVDRFILEHGYGCDAELIPGDTMPTGTSMIEKGQPDVAPELWSNSLKDALDKGVEEKRLRYAGKALLDGGEEGFWIPAYLVKQYPEMKSIEGVKKHAKLFSHPEDKAKSAFYSCPAGWNCQISAGNLFKAMDLADSGFDIIDPGSSAGLYGSIAKAYEREQAWFGYYWAPTAVLGKYDMVKVDFGSGVNEEEFVNCTTQADCESPKTTMYPPSPVHTITTEEFASRSPAAYGYFTKRGFTNADMNQLLAWMEDNQADGEETMFHFLENYPQIWTTWVPQDVAKKVQSAL